jgi:hypothetical protein
MMYRIAARFHGRLGYGNRIRHGRFHWLLGLPETSYFAATKSLRLTFLGKSSFGLTFCRAK